MATPLTIAIAQANQKNYALLLALADRYSEIDDFQLLLDLARSLKGFGFVNRAVLVLTGISIDAPISVINQRDFLKAGLLQDLGQHVEALSLYRQLLTDHPDNRNLFSNYLLALEYVSDVCDEDRYTAAIEWGMQIQNTIGKKPRPKMHDLGDRKLRIGYVSSDFCQHTVGLLINQVLIDQTDFADVFTYSSGMVNDWVTDLVKAKTVFRDVSRLSDDAVASCIKNDKIDVLVDLSGHTSNSRLAVFALRPSPVMISWLGYFATTGLQSMDAVLLDQWHVSKGSQCHFVEKIVLLSSGRITYSTVPWMPEVSDLPFLKNGYITFGSFNNTNKLNECVLATWACILKQLPTSKLILKWRTLNDPEIKKMIWQFFESNGVLRGRVELRPSSFHNELLAEYQDVDICLDPFPFTGGLTSLEALYLGRPVVTWPQSRVVSRQTFAFLSSMNLTELACVSREGYIAKAIELATDQNALLNIHAGLRSKMRDSLLMNPKAQAMEIVTKLKELYLSIKRNES